MRCVPCTTPKVTHTPLLWNQKAKPDQVAYLFGYRDGFLRKGVDVRRDQLLAVPILCMNVGVLARPLRCERIFDLKLVGGKGTQDEGRQWMVLLEREQDLFRC